MAGTKHLQNHLDPAGVSANRYDRQAENQWLLTEYKSLKDEVSLSSVPVQLALSDTYEGVLTD